MDTKGILNPTIIARIALNIAASICIAYYFGTEGDPAWLFGCLCFLLLLCCPLNKNARSNPSGIPQKRMSIWLISILFALSVVLGHHIAITGSSYSGTADVNFISPYTGWDAIALALIAYGASTLISSLLSRISRKSFPAPCMDTISTRRVLAASLVLFLLWLPYLLAYWPGIIFYDTLNSLRQTLGVNPWVNHHPAAYTAFLGLFVHAATATGYSATTGMALYSITQMILVATGLSYCANWVAVRGRLKRVVVWALIGLFGLSSYIAAFSIAAWKDPIFSIALLIVSLRLFDLAWKKTAPNAAYLASVALLFFVVGVARSNGMIIELVLLLGLAVVMITQPQTRFMLMRTTAVLCATTVFVVALTGPGYQLLGISKAPKEESVGILLNQMARTAALDGNLSANDKKYMDSLLPLELYSECYRPTCTDLLKWDERFNGRALDNKGFFKHWLSMLARNPKLYFEAWELQTYGFWAVNRVDVNTYCDSFYAGPVNWSEDGLKASGELGIRPRNLLGDDNLRELFHVDGWFIPISWINWLLILLVLCLWRSGAKWAVIGLAPSLCLAGTLILSSPIWCSPRYAAEEQFLLPVIGLLFYMLLRRNVIQAPMQTPADSNRSST